MGRQTTGAFLKEPCEDDDDDDGDHKPLLGKAVALALREERLPLALPLPLGGLSKIRQS